MLYCRPMVSSRDWRKGDGMEVESVGCIDDTRPIDRRLDNVMRSGGRAQLQR
jgi:hypothetical protein